MEVAREVGFPRALEGDLYYSLLLSGCTAGGYSPIRARSRAVDSAVRGECGARIVSKIGLSESVQNSMQALDERWDGQGYPYGFSGEEIPLIARVVSFAHALTAEYTEAGPATALEMARNGARTYFDPMLCRAAESLASRGALWKWMDDANRRVLALEPALQPLEADRSTLDRICEAFGDLSDAKTPLVRHSAGVASVAVYIARILGLRPSEITVLRRAAWLHDIGKLAIPSAILEKPSKLTAEEWGVLKTHAVYSYEILKRTPGFEEVSEIAGAHHEKLDGSGYFRGLKGDEISLQARILVVADIYDALSAKRPYRDALPAELAFQIMQLEAPHALDQDCLDALTHSFDPSSIAAELAQLSVNVQQ